MANKSYVYRVYNITDRKTTSVKTIKELAAYIGFTDDLDDHDNWFYQNLLNMTNREYINSDDKDSLIFHWNDLVVVRDSKAKS